MLLPWALLRGSVMWHAELGFPKSILLFAGPFLKTHSLGQYCQDVGTHFIRNSNLDVLTAWERHWERHHWNASSGRSLWAWEERSPPQAAPLQSGPTLPQQHSFNLHPDGGLLSETLFYCGLMLVDSVHHMSQEQGSPALLRLGTTPTQKLA